MDILRAYSKRRDLLDDLTRLDHRLQRALRSGEPGQRRSVSSTGRIGRKWALEERLTDEEADALVASFLAGATKRQLADQYGISPKSVQRLLRRHGVHCATGKRPTGRAR